MQPAKRITDLPPYLFAEVDKKIAAKRAAGYDVISLGIGDPDLPTPSYIVEELHRASLEAANHRYPDYYGLAGLRRANADWYDERFGVKLEPDSEVLPLIGSKEGIAHMPVAFIDPGDVALVPDPGYPVYSIGTMLANGESYFMPLLEENGFLPDLSAIPPSVADQAKLIWINYPNNPTAAVAPPEFFEQVVAFAKKHDLIVCHDNDYSDVSYDGYRPQSFLETPGALNLGVEFHSLSKTFNMTGWRIGMAVGKAMAIEALGRVKTNVDSGVFQAIQFAAIEALLGDKSWLPERNMIYQNRRDRIIAGLETIGVKAQKPKASLYIWGRVPKGYTSVDFSLKVLDDIAVWITPGNGFGQYGEGYFRISMTTPDHRVDEALKRLADLKL
jgi:LL-diaminopimelate aminotransferase